MKINFDNIDSHVQIMDTQESDTETHTVGLCEQPRLPRWRNYFGQIREVKKNEGE